MNEQHKKEITSIKKDQEEMMHKIKAEQESIKENYELMYNNNQKHLEQEIDTIRKKNAESQRIFEEKHFFIPFNEFHKKFYCEFFRNYFISKENNKLNAKIISYSPLLFKAVKRKIEKFGLGHRTEVIQNLYEDTIRQFIYRTI